MIKIILLLLITFSASYSKVGTYLFVNDTRCVQDLTPNKYTRGRKRTTGWCYSYSSLPSSKRCNTSAKLTDFIKGYDYNFSTGLCTLENDLQITGLDKDAHNNIMLFLSIAFSLIFFTTLFMLVF